MAAVTTAPGVDAPGDGAPPPRGRRIGKVLWRIAVGLCAAVLVAVLGFGLLLLTTPGVGGAEAKVAAILAAHHAPGDGGVIPSRVGAALLATEDSRYWSDPALDPLGTVRALWGTVADDPDAGGATIEIQLAKLLYTPGQGDLLAEARQVAIAFKLDASYTKRQILAMYLDAAYFGDGAYGVTAAAQRYFGRAPDDLTWGQASLIAGLVQAPSAYNPTKHLTLALERRHHVLARLVATGVLTAGQAAAVARAPLDPVVTFGN